MKEIKWTDVISDRALDLGVFALDNEFENGSEGMNLSYRPSFKASVTFSPRPGGKRVDRNVQARNIFSIFFRA